MTPVTAPRNCPMSTVRPGGSKNGSRYPMWVDDPRECWSRGFIPITLLRPEDMEDVIDQWVEEAITAIATDKFPGIQEPQEDH